MLATLQGWQMASVGFFVGKICVYCAYSKKPYQMFRAKQKNLVHSAFKKTNKQHTHFGVLPPFFLVGVLGFFVNKTISRLAHRKSWSVNQHNKVFFKKA